MDSPLPKRTRRVRITSPDGLLHITEREKTQ